MLERCRATEFLLSLFLAIELPCTRGRLSHIPDSVLGYLSSRGTSAASSCKFLGCWICALPNKSWGNSHASHTRRMYGEIIKLKDLRQCSVRIQIVDRDRVIELK
jgi:hypothetical protein